MGAVDGKAETAVAKRELSSDRWKGAWPVPPSQTRGAPCLMHEGPAEDGEAWICERLFRGEDVAEAPKFPWDTGPPSPTISIPPWPSFSLSLQPLPPHSMPSSLPPPRRLSAPCEFHSTPYHLSLPYPICNIRISNISWPSTNGTSPIHLHQMKRGCPTCHAMKSVSPIRLLSHSNFPFRCKKVVSAASFPSYCWEYAKEG